MFQIFRITLAASLLASAHLVGFSPLSAQTCPAPLPIFGSCSTRTIPTDADFPFAVTVAESESRVIVADLVSGLFYKYPSVDIDSAPAEVFSGPLGPAQVTGVAWHPASDELYWVLNAGTNDRFVRSTLDGTLISNNPITGYAANFSGLTWNPGTGSFWTVDFLNDTYVELDLTGAWTGNSFQVPSSAPLGGLAYGLGITAALDPIGGWLFDVPLGTPGDLRAARIERVSATGALLGLGYDLDADNSASGWITGVAWTPVGSTGAAVTFVVDLTENRLTELPTSDLLPYGVHGLSCIAESTGEVTLSWTNGETYSSIAVQRDGVTIEVIAGDSTTYVDSGPIPSGTIEYRLEPLALAGEALPTVCSVVTGAGRALANAPFGGVGAFAITVIESIDRIIVAELSGGSAHLYDKNLVADGTVLLSPFTGGDATTGIAWNSTDDTLLWHSGETGFIQKTDLAGVPIGPGIALAPLPAGTTGDIAYSPLSETYFGVLIDTQTIFEFLDEGTVIGSCPPPLVDGGPAIATRGVAVVADALGAEVVLDVTIGPEGFGEADRVMRLTDCSVDPFTYDLLPTTVSGAITGLAWTSLGSNGTPSEYVVGFDTNRIYEIDLTAAEMPLEEFRRGDVNIDGAVDIADPTSILAALFLTGTILCADAADANDDGGVDIADAIATLTYLFIGGVAIPEPVECGSDPTDDLLDCDDYPSCP